jgi:hypothetical protein
MAAAGRRVPSVPVCWPTHCDDEIWALVSFVKQLPKLTTVQSQADAGHHRPCFGNVYDAQKVAPAPEIDLLKSISPRCLGMMRSGWIALDLC